MTRPYRRARPLTEEQLDELAQIAAQDIEAARQWWQEHAPPGYEDMLDALIERGALDDPDA